MNKTRSLFFAFAVGILTLQSCKDDEEKPVFQIAAPNVSATGYTGTGTIGLLYSVDNGATYSATLPKNMSAGTKVLVKVNNGTEDLSDEDFSFNWSDSSPAPVSTTTDIAEFTVGNANLTIQVVIEDLWTLITSHRQNGKFFSVNPQTGATSDLFTPKYEGADFKDVRAFVYHPKQRLYYASGSANLNELFTINPSTKEATLINDNDGDINGDGIEDYKPWYAIANWAVAADDSLVAIGDFDEGVTGIVKFGKDGGRSAKTTDVDICCGLGMIWEDANTILIANGWSTNNSEVILQKLGLNGQFVGDPQSITNFENFPDDLAETWVTVKSMAKAKDGSIYGLLFNTESDKTYFVKFDRTNNKISYISTLGANNSNQYNTMTFIPNHLL